MNRDKLLARIKALLSKTVADGATEAEELAAFEKARELIERYQIDLGAEEVKREGYVQRLIKLDHIQFAFAQHVLKALETFCEVYIWYSEFTPMDEKQHTYLHRSCVTVMGFASDAEFAAYLIEHLINFALAGADRHVATERKMAIMFGSPMDAAESKAARRSYLIGCALRINQRLTEMASQRQQKAATGYGALVKLDKHTLITAEIARLGICISEVDRKYIGARDAGAFLAGNDHGGRATFSRPISGSRVAGLIERK